jgi:hypothetical protein
MQPSHFAPSEPSQVDVRESSTPAPRRTATRHLCETKKKKNTFAVSLLRMSPETALEETSTKFLHFDQVYSTAIAAEKLKRQSILHILQQFGDTLLCM